MRLALRARGLGPFKRSEASEDVQTWTRRQTIGALAGVAASAASRAGGEVMLLNVSYDPTRELYSD